MDGKKPKRAKAMLPEIRNMIILAATSSQKNRESLARQLILEIKRKFPKEVPPVKETVEKLISKARNPKISPFDKPWNLGVLNRLRDLGIENFDSEAIKYIQMVHRYINTDIRDLLLKAIEERKKLPGYNPYEKTPLSQLSIRQAKWVARLYRLTDGTIRNITAASHIYTVYENMCEISGVPFDTFSLDECLPDVDKLRNLWLSKYPFDDVHREAAEKTSFAKEEEVK